MTTRFAMLMAICVITTTLGMLVAFGLGRRYRRTFHERHPTADVEGIHNISATIFGLLALLLAFTFATASAHFDARRKLIVEEANAIGTAYRRLTLLPADARPRLQDEFRRYLDSRIALQGELGDRDAVRRRLEETTALQDELWNDVVKVLEREPSAKLLLVNALTAMLEVTTSRLAWTEFHLPYIVFAMLWLCSIACVFLIGFDVPKDKAFSVPHVAGFGGIVVFVIVVVMDFEYPRLGFIRIDPMDHLLVDLRARMK